MSSFTQSSIDIRLAIYTLAAGALTAGSVNAAPTTSPSSFPVVGTPNGTQIFIDGDSNFDFTLYTYSDEGCTYNGGSSYLERNSGYAGGIKYLASFDYAGMISDGASVSSIDNFYYQGYLAGCSHDDGEFPVPSRGFVGVKFFVGQNQHFGYLDVETSAGSLVTTVHGACYESDPDTPIDLDACLLRDDSDLAGPVSVPVGGLIPMSLAVLGLGAAASRRRRKNQQ